MDPSATASQGLFLADTRYLSTFQLRLNDEIPILLGSSEEMLFQASFLHTNPDLSDIPSRGIGILQKNSIHAGSVTIDLTLANWALKPLSIELSIEVGCDFFDSFEARGVKRLKRGELRPIRASRKTVELQYLGLDDVLRSTIITSDRQMDHFDDNRMYFQVEAGINERVTISLDVKLVEHARKSSKAQPAPEVTHADRPPWFERATKISVSNTRVEALLQRSIDDLEALLTEFPGAWVPAAGLPRFGVPFGRDSIITGLETLVWNHELSRDVLRFLAARQGKENNPWNYEQPGKIMHELHTGELARLKEVPFGLFYGSVDATPLFLVLAAEHLRWTGDLALYRDLKPHYDAAWTWIDEYGDIDKSGYVQYQAHTPPKLSSEALTVGLFNQGWKDNALAVMYADGSMVTEHPIALAEVQGYLYRALTLWADLYRHMPDSEGMECEAERLEARAEKLRRRFNEEFWMPDKGYYAMALDGKHRHVDSITSNPGHCLWSRLIDEECAEQVAATLMKDNMMTSWGIRTMASTEKAYNPFSYHDGSIWPFDNAVIAAGLKKYGFVWETQAVFDALLEASVYFEYRRLPELYCGVSRQVGGVLARQPDASRPQAWSAGATFLLLQTILGIAPRPFSRRVDITPALPSCLNELTVDNLSIAGASLSLRVVREGNSVLMEIKENPDDLDIVIHPAVRNHRHIAGPHMPAISR